MSYGVRRLPRGRATACRCMSRGCARGWPTPAPTGPGWSVTRAATGLRCSVASATWPAGSRRLSWPGGGGRGGGGEGVEEALGIWLGEPLGGLSANSLLAAERGHLEEERLAAIIEGIELDLELG